MLTFRRSIDLRKFPVQVSTMRKMKFYRMKLRNLNACMTSSARHTKARGNDVSVSFSFVDAMLSKQQPSTVGLHHPYVNTVRPLLKGIVPDPSPCVLLVVIPGVVFAGPLRFGCVSLAMSRLL